MKPKSRRRRTEKRGSGVPWRWLGVILVVGLSANLLVWLWPRQPQVTADYPTYAEALIEQGEMIFAANCATCHGETGQGSAAAGVPALDGSMHAWHHGDDQIEGFLRRGVGRMPAVGARWSDEEIAAVLAYVKQWWGPEQRAYQARVSRNER